MFPVVKGMHSNVCLLTPSFTIRLKCLLDNTLAFSKINPVWTSVFESFSKSDLSPLSLIQLRSPVTTWPAGGYRNGESAQEHDFLHAKY